MKVVAKRMWSMVNCEKMICWSKRRGRMDEVRKIMIGRLKDESKKSTESAVSECMMEGRNFEMNDNQKSEEFLNNLLFHFIYQNVCIFWISFFFFFWLF